MKIKEFYMEYLPILNSYELHFNEIPTDIPVFKEDLIYSKRLRSNLINKILKISKRYSQEDYIKHKKIFWEKNEKIQKVFKKRAK